MPGLNQRGPMNEGPMTGGRRGICTGASNAGTGRGGGWFAQGAGRRCGRRGGRGFGRGGDGYYDGYDAPPVQAVPARETLQQRADRLEAELAAVKRQLGEMAGPKAD